MKFIFRGVRGSIATPGPNTVRYGGNTTCIEIRTENDDLIILDAGTGIHALGQKIQDQLPISANIFITHTHWDHIQGLPFFSPIFSAGNQIKIYGGMDPQTTIGIERTLGVQLQYSYFPIVESELKADIEYCNILSGQAVTIGTATVTPILLNHPVLNFGYRIDSDKQSIFFTGDYEPLFNPYSKKDKQYLNYQKQIDNKQDEILRVLKNVDVLIVDSTYTADEYVSKKGWGHGTFESAIQLAKQVNAKKLYFTHHEPSRTDQQLDQIYLKLLDDYSGLALDLCLAKEGIEILL